ncbi:MAG: glycosyltransferase family 4 protein [Pseudomonadota bacterium]
MSRALWFASPGDPALRTGGYLYNAAICARLGVHGFEVRAIRLPDAFPYPSVADQEEAAVLLGAVPSDDLLVVDGLAFGAVSSDVIAAIRAPTIALVHHPLADETGLTPSAVAAFEASERGALASTIGVVTSSPSTGTALVDRFGVPRDRLETVIPGVEKPASRPAGRDDNASPLILSVGSLTHRKGHDVLIDALARLRDHPWRAVIVGSPDLAPDVAQALASQVEDAGLSDRVMLAGTLEAEALQQLYRSADVFALATRHEGYGMVFSEAMVHGLPIVSCAVGAVPDTVPEATGLLVPADDAVALASALEQLLEDPALYGAKAAGAARVGAALPDWDDAAAEFASALRRLSTDTESSERSVGASQ